MKPPRPWNGVPASKGIANAWPLSRSAFGGGGDSWLRLRYPPHRIRSHRFPTSSSCRMQAVIQLYTWHKGTSTLFPGSVLETFNRRALRERSFSRATGCRGQSRDLHREHRWIRHLRLTNTTSLSADEEPSLSPDGQTVVFSSNRSGTSRIWTTKADGTNQAALNTGSSANIPESSPRFSPSGDRILFSSARSNTTQIWILPVAGGAATQVTHEPNGAFEGSWGPDGNAIFYVDGTDRTKIHKIVVSSGDESDYVTNGTDVGNQDCTNALCLVTTHATSSGRDIYAYIGAADSVPIPVVQSSSEEYQPAILHP